MKKSNVKRFDMGGYTAGMEAMGRRAADDAQRAAKKARRDEQIALDKADAIEEFAPEKYLIPGMAARRAIPAALRAGADILKDEFMGPQTSEGLPTSQRLKDVRSRVAPGRLVRNKADMERIAGYRDQYKPGTSNTRNAKLRGEAEEMGIPYKDYLKGKSKAERASMGLEAEQTSTNAMDRFKKGGKVGKVMGEFKSGSLKSSSGQKVANRKQAMAIAISEAGKSKMKKFAEGGNVKKMAGGGMKGGMGNSGLPSRNPIDQMKQAANLVKTVKSEAAKRGMLPAATRNSRPDMGVMPGYRGPQSPKGMKQGGNVKKYAMGGGLGAMPPKVAPTTTAPKTSLGVPPIAKSFLTKAGSNPPNVAGTYKPSTPAPNMGVLPGYRGPQSPERPIPAKPLDPNITDTFPRTPSTYSGPQPSATNRALFMKKGGKVGESKKMAKGGMSCMKKGGDVQKFAKGGSIDGCAVRGKTKLKRVKM